MASFSVILPPTRIFLGSSRKKILTLARSVSTVLLSLTLRSLPIFLPKDLTPGSSRTIPCSPEYKRSSSSTTKSAKSGGGSIASNFFLMPVSARFVGSNGGGGAVSVSVSVSGGGGSTVSAVSISIVTVSGAAVSGSIVVKISSALAKCSRFFVTLKIISGESEKLL